MDVQVLPTCGCIHIVRSSQARTLLAIPRFASSEGKSGLLFWSCFVQICLKCGIPCMSVFLCCHSGPSLKPPLPLTVGTQDCSTDACSLPPLSSWAFSPPLSSVTSCLLFFLFLQGSLSFSSFLLKGSYRKNFETVKCLKNVFYLYNWWVVWLSIVFYVGSTFLWKWR